METWYSDGKIASKMCQHITVMETCYSDGTIPSKMYQARNYLPNALRNTSTIKGFKNNLKTQITQICWTVFFSPRRKLKFFIEI